MKEGWKYQDFEKCLIKVSKQKAVKSKDYLSEGRFPVVSQESGLVSGYSNDPDLLYKHQKPVVIFGDHTKNIKYVDFDFVVGADGVHILYPVDQILPKFLYYEICSIKLRSLGYARHYKLLKEKQIAYPPLSEQKRIVEFLDAGFAKIDAIKTNAERQLQAAKDLFQAALKEMLTPKDGWKEKTLPDISHNLDGKRIPVTQNKRTAGIYPYYGASGIVDYVNDYIFDDTLLLISEDGANLLARTTPIAFTIKGKNWVNNHAHVIKIEDDSLRRYVEYYFANLNIEEYVTGAAQPKLTQKALNRIRISIPNDHSIINKIITALDDIQMRTQQLQSNYDKTLTLCNDLKQALLKSIFE